MRNFSSGQVLFTIYMVGDIATFIYLTFFDGYIYTWWNWAIAIPANILLSFIWPIYWGIFRGAMPLIFGD